MKKHFKRVYLGILSAVFMLAAVASSASAGCPATNVEGVGGCGLNPFAYLANPGKGKAVGMPQVAIWNIGLTEAHLNWTSGAVNITLFDRVELGYSHEFVDIQNSHNVDKDNLSMKVNLIPENFQNMNFMPAISAGLIWKNTDWPGLRHTGGLDYYVVATKMIKATPVPIILNAGLLSTKGYIRGVAGFGEDRDTAFFCNIESILFNKFMVGWEYEQDTDVGKVMRNSDVNKGTSPMWTAHVAYMYDANLMFVAGFAYTGDRNSSTLTGHGSGYLFSMQYAF